MMRKLIALFSIAFVVSSCGRLDDIAYYNDNTIDQYYFDGWSEEGEFVLNDPAYFIDNNMINEVVLSSQGPDESTATPIYAFYIGDLATIGSDTIIVYCHGQSAHMDAYWSRVKLLANCGGKNRFGVLEMDYRGFGLSEGKPSEKGMYADVQACLDWLKSMNVEASNAVMYGFSLGSVPATEMAANSDYKVSKLILESPMASADNIGQESLLINFNTHYIVDLEFNNAEKIKKIDQPFLWMHGTADDYLKISNGEIIYRNYDGAYGEVHKVEGARHGAGGVPETLGFDEYLKIVEEFIVR